MDKWNEIRTAYIVAKAGTISAAADHLGTHRATVIRHIDTLEDELGIKVFLRHSKGYTPTEIGQDLLRVATQSEHQINQFFARVKMRHRGFEGDLVLTSIDLVVDQVIHYAKQFHDKYPNVTIRFVTTTDLLKLEYGDAHIAFRIIGKATNRDYVVRPFTQLRFAPYAHERYVKDNGLPKTVNDYAHHTFVGPDVSSDESPMSKWFRKYVPLENMVFQGNDMVSISNALNAGMGIGFLPIHMARDLPSLVQVMPPSRIWAVNISTVTHVDLNQSAKVRAFLDLLKAGPAP